MFVNEFEFFSTSLMNFFKVNFSLFSLEKIFFQEIESRKIQVHFF
jgi:hypothetical protein